MKPINRFSLLHDPIIHDRLNKMVEQLNGNFTEQEATQRNNATTFASQAALIKILTARVDLLEQNVGTVVIQQAAPATLTKKVVTKKKVA